MRFVREEAVSLILGGDEAWLSISRDDDVTSHTEERLMMRHRTWKEEMMTRHRAFRGRWG